MRASPDRARLGFARAGAAAAVLGMASGIAVARPERFVLDNGATVIVEAVPGVGWVGVESFYGVGFVHEPAGLTQVAHLVEHLVCMGAAPGFGPGEAFAHLNAIGVSNAETLAHFTHYDAMAPADRLGEVLRIEAARLGGLEIDGALIAQEAPRCYQEAAAVESSPQAPVFKFALMAANQSWRHGATEALVKGGLIEAPVERVRAFHAEHYTPRSLTLVVVGDTTAADVKRIAAETIGGIPGGPAAAGTAIDWSAARDRTVRWDSSAECVIIAYAPPADAVERMALTMRGVLAMQALSADAELKKDAVFALGSSHLYPVGELPLFVCATIRPGADAGAADRIGARFRAIWERPPSAAELAQLRMFVDQMARPPALSEAAIRRQAAQIAPMLGVTEERAAGMALGQAALNIGVGAMLSGNADALDAVQKMSAEEMAAIVKRVTGGAPLVTRLVPMEK